MKKSLIIVILFVLGYLFVSNVLKHFSHPMIQETAQMTKEERKVYFNSLTHEQYTTYIVEYGEYVTLKFKIYSVLFLLPFVYMFYNPKVKLIKSIAMFGIFIAFASAADKIIFNFYQFKATDWIVIAAGIIGGLYVHLKARD